MSTETAPPDPRAEFIRDAVRNAPRFDEERRERLRRIIAGHESKRPADLEHEA